MSEEDGGRSEERRPPASDRGRTSDSRPPRGRGDKPPSRRRQEGRSPRSGAAREAPGARPPGRGDKSDRGRSDGGRDRRGRRVEAPSRDGRDVRSADQRRYDGPQLPDDVSSEELDRGVRRQLSGLPERLADRVGRHLAMAARTLHRDPELAYLHALAARARASRVAVVREACGETAYSAGRFAEALTELRAARRMSGSAAYLPMMADSERALGRPARALALSCDAAVGGLDRAGQVEMAIVAAGARRDLGQVEAALQLLESEDLRSRSHADWVARLRYAYADTLLAAGRRADAVEWFHRTAAVDAERLTDADERLRELEAVED